MMPNSSTYLRKTKLIKRINIWKQKNLLIQIRITNLHLLKVKQVMQFHKSKAKKVIMI